MSMSFLVREMSRLVSTGDAFALESIQGRLALPKLGAHGPQDAVSTFVGAHEVLGKLGGTLPDLDFYDTDGQPERTGLVACAWLAYHHPHERQDPSLQTQHAGSVALLTSVGGAQALATVALVERSCYGEFNANNRFVPRFRETCLYVARKGLGDATEAVDYFAKGPSEWSHRAVAVSILERYGNRADLPMLRSLVDDDEVGVAALSAIKRLEGSPEGTHL